jgi:hypothetical protein
MHASADRLAHSDGRPDPLGAVELVTRPAWRLRLAGRLPRLLLAVFLLTMSVAGVRSVLAPRDPQGPAASGPPAAGDQAAQAFAEGFARAYLSWDAARPEAREHALARFISDELDPSGGVEPTRSQDVGWTAVIAVRRRGARQLVTVAAEAGGRRYQLAVPVERDANGLLAVVGYPALVGAPPVGLDREPVDEDDVADPQLRAVCERAVRNYLAGERGDLVADLDAHAVVSLPDQRFEVRAVEGFTRIGPGAVAVQVRAAGDGALWTLRYELEVVRRERWYVRAISTDPRATTTRRSP